MDLLSTAVNWSPSQNRMRKKYFMAVDQLDDLHDIVLKYGYYKKKLIFKNTQKQKNGQVYEKVSRKSKRNATKGDKNYHLE